MEETPPFVRSVGFHLEDPTNGPQEPLKRLNKQIGFKGSKTEKDRSVRTGVWLGDDAISKVITRNKQKKRDSFISALTVSFVVS